MSFLRKLFGPSKDEIWRELCREIGADFIEGGPWGGHKVKAQVDQWTVTLDSYTLATEYVHQVYTRLRAPYVNRDNFRFTIYRKTAFSGLGKKLGMQDIEIGDPAFDDDFIIQANQPERIRALLEPPHIRELIRIQPAFHLSVRDDEGWFGEHFDADVDELCFQVPELLTNIAQLKSLYELFSLLLHRLCEIGAAYEKDPHVQL